MTTYDQYGPHGSGSGPIWIVNAPTEPYPDERFDGVTPPLDPQQPMPNDVIANAARDALDNIETVLMHWTFHFISPMSKLRALRDVLKPPTPKWTATQDEDE